MAAPSAAAQDPPSAPSLEEAATFFEAEDWKSAAKSYQRIVERESSNGQAWLRLGLSWHSLKRYERAIGAYEQAERLGFALPRTRYNLACAYALMNETNQAFAWLDKALASGFSRVQVLETDSDLDGLRSDSRFKTVLKKADQNARPCAYDSVYWQFDFWVGEWDVFTAQEQKAGINIIQKTENGCLLLENWASSLGGTGKSMNFYDPSIKKWRQHWVDSEGGVSSYQGEFKDGSMYFTGEAIAKDGTKELTRMTFTPLPDGRVRQTIEQSKNGGKTWYVYFDGYYVKKK